MNKIIEFKNVSFSYDEGEECVLKGIDLSFYEGQFTCVLGHNGSGKSTMAKLINPTFCCVITFDHDFTGK